MTLIKQITVPQQIDCSSDITPVTLISPFECIGDSLSIINDNFDSLQKNDEELCESLASTIETLETIVIPPVNSVVAWYVDGSKSNIVNAGNVVLDSSAITKGREAYIQVSGAIDKSWALCTGATINGITTPDLIGRFIVGAGSPARTVYPQIFNGESRVYEANTGGGQETSLLNPGMMPKLAVKSADQSSTDATPPTITLQSAKKFVTDAKVSGTGTTKSSTSTSASKKTFVTGISDDEELVTVSGQASLATGTPNPSRFLNLPPFLSLYYIIRVR